MGRYAHRPLARPVDAALGGTVRALRHRRGWRQVELALAASTGPGVVGLLERGRADRLSVRSLRRICGALDLRVGWDAGFRGTELARLRDADHRFAIWNEATSAAS